MMRWLRAAAAAVSLSMAAGAAYGQACTQTINPGADLTATVAAAAPGAVICLNAGTYFPPAAGFPNNQTFAIGNAVTVRGNGATPASVILQGGAAGGYVIFMTNYLNNGKVASGATLQNLTIQGGQGGIQVFNFTNQPAGRLSSITLKDLVINTVSAGGSGNGVLVQSADRINIDGVTTTSRGAGINLLDATDTLVMNSNITRTINNQAVGLSVIGGSGHVIVGNTIGTANQKYSFENTGAVVFYNTINNRFENNVVQGFRHDGVAIDSKPGMPVAAGVNSTNNYVGKNTIISTASADFPGQLGGSGIWSNCASNGTWIYGNEARGTPECGVCVYIGTSNMVQGNLLYDNGIAGIVLSGGSEVLGSCSSVANQPKPVATFLKNNNAFFNRTDQLHIRNADSTEIAGNYTSPKLGFQGPLRSDCQIPPYCTSFLTLDSNNGSNNVGVRVVGNTNDQNIRGVQQDDGQTTAFEFAYNRMIQSENDGIAFSRFHTVPSVNWDGGPVTGGNYWTLFTGANGNPGTNPYGSPGQSNAHFGVWDTNPSNTTGKIVDRYPYQSETLGRSGNVTVFEPRTNQYIAAGSRRTVRWYGPACVLVDIALGGTTLASNIGNIGYHVVTIPAATPAGSNTITVTCRSSSGAGLGSGTSGAFNVSASTLQLLAPGRDDVFNSGQQIVVGWKKTAAITSVNIDLSVDGGSTFPHSLATNQAGTMARVTLPAIQSTANAVIRVISAAPATRDYTDGYFAIRGAGGHGFTNVGGGRQFVMGQQERLEWASPQNSRLVDISATVNGVTRTVVFGLPDRGNYDWVVPEFAQGVVTLNISYKQMNGTLITTANNANGSTVNPTVTQPPNPPRMSNISTRMQVLTGAEVMIAGFVIGGPGSKKVAIVATGPSLSNFGITNPLGDPKITLVRSSDQAVIASNDNWVSASNFTEIQNSGFAPSHPLESVILTTLAPGAYTAVVEGMNGSTGVAVAAVYEVDAVTVPLVNISTRGKVLTGQDVMIGGFVITGSGPQQVAIVATGPSLGAFGITNPLANPTITLVRSSDQAVLATNDNWQDAPNAAAIQSAGFSPSNPLEAAIMTSLAPGAYTAIVQGSGGGTGIAVIGVYKVN
jgi:hypothetical protein